MALFRRSAPKPEESPSLPAAPSDAERRVADLAQYNYLEEPYVSLKNKVQLQLIAQQSARRGGGDPTALNPTELREEIRELYEQAVSESGLILNRSQKEQLLEQIVAEILGYGPIDAFLHDDEVTEIMVNGAHQVYIERRGKLSETNVTFQDDEHVIRIIQRIIAPLGRRIDESSPMVDARLPDGSRVNAVIPPLAIDGPTINIRRFARIPYTTQDLILFGTLTPELVQFLEACVKARLNIIISGGTGTGKTTLLNVVSGFLPENERIITIEDAAELQLRQRHVVRLEARPPNIEGKGQITIRQLVINALRMRPDRMIVGEARGGEALDMLQAMNTGHDGSMTTIHSSNPRDTLRRIETMVLMAGMDLPLRAIREQLASAIDLIVHLQRMSDGVRRVTQVSEVQGMEGDTIVMQDIFVWKQTGIENGRVIGRLVPTGIRPGFMAKLEMAGVSLPAEIFGYTGR
ncbi:MAG: CpaF family protein [Anaerolineae bacterium]|nr:CpaF family protein [Anaerolineae bacterium]